MDTTEIWSMLDSGVEFNSEDYRGAPSAIRALLAVRLVRRTGMNPDVANKVVKVATSTYYRMLSIEKYGGREAVDAVLKGKVPIEVQYRRTRPANAPKLKRLPKAQRRRFVRERLAAPAYRHLTRKEVDPEFNGTATEFVDKYGHVQAETAEQRAAGRFTAWVFNVRALVGAAKRLPGWPEVDHNWLRSPKARDAPRLAEALDYLRPLLAEAEALLARANLAMTGSDLSVREPAEPPEACTTE
jgi:hypothetical protein